jgi:hypothetical protein
MLLYHYNVKRLNALYTPRKQYELGIMDETSFKYRKQYGDDYIDHISLFLDPIPLDLVRKHFTLNKTYQTNKFIFEHQVDCSQLMTNLHKFSLKENPINNFMVNYLWVDSNLVKPIYFNIRSLLTKSMGYDGDTYEDLIKVINKFKGKTTQAFIDVIASDKFSDNLKRMYAPYVPHLFVFPINGELSVYKVIKRDFEINY